VKEAIQKMEEANALDATRAAAIFAQIAADAEKQRVERWKILQDTQKMIFEIQQDVAVNRARSTDKAFSAWEKYIKG